LLRAKNVSTYVFKKTMKRKNEFVLKKLFLKMYTKPDVRCIKNNPISLMNVYTGNPKLTYILAGQQ
jgi:hypothetical protein